jgi:hypothetical protein
LLNSVVHYTEHTLRIITQRFPVSRENLEPSKKTRIGGIVHH